MKKIDHDHHQETVLKEEADIFSNPDYQKYRRSWTEYPENFYVSNFPMNLDVHVTNRCTLRCKMCRRTLLAEKGELGKTGFMDMSIYKAIIDEAANEGCYAVHLSGNGEPLLHNGIVEMIDYAHKMNILDVFMHTNATLLNREMSLELLDSGLTRLIISFDSPVPETYESIRVGAKFDVVLDNIKTFAALKQEKNLTYPLLRIQMVDMKENSDERDQFDNLFSEIADSIGHTSYINYLGLDKEDRSIEVKNYREDFICPQLWQRLSIEWDSKVYACLVINEDFYLGDAGKIKIKEMWHSSLMNELRDKHRSSQFSSISGCEQCGRQYKA